MGSLIYSCCSRRLNLVGLEALEPTTPQDRVLLVANHRSFFDFYTITAVLFWRTRFPRRIFFPTRSTFFYDRAAGPIVNLSMSAMRMFPPILRDGSRGTFNNWAIDRCVAELNTPGTMVGIHPEGTRNKSPDPCSFLPAQPGAGRLALCADPGVRVIPVYALGIGNSIASEMKKNVTAPEAHPTTLYFGAPIDFADLRERGIRATTAKRAADRCLDAIRALAEQHRRDTGAASAGSPATERAAG
jgi:1-acyl-sn-glycerol-3-phosphate acyltransferase